MAKVFHLNKDLCNDLSQVKHYRTLSNDNQQKINEMHEKLLENETPISDADYSKLRSLYQQSVELSQKEEM